MIRTCLLSRGLLTAALFALAACRPAQAQSLRFTYSSFDVPGAYTAMPYDGTDALGISNNGTIVGEYDTSDTTGSGFVLKNGVLTDFNYPGTVTGDYTYLRDVNASGVMTGEYDQASTGNVTQFIYRNGTFSSPTPANAVGGPVTFSTVTDSGLVAMQYNDAAGVVHGAIYNINTDTFTDVASAPVSATPDFHLLGVNDSGAYVGTYLDAGGNFQGAFSQGGAFTYLSLPGASSTRPSGINASGLITGRYFTNGSSDPTGGFLYDHGTYYTLQYPGALSTNVTGGAINDRNQIVGYYLDQNSAAHGMLITVTPVPEPGSVALLTGMAISGGIFLHRRARTRRAS